MAAWKRFPSPNSLLKNSLPAPLVPQRRRRAMSIDTAKTAAKLRRSGMNTGLSAGAAPTELVLANRPGAIDIARLRRWDG